MIYCVVIYCGDCSFGQDPMGCFEGGTDRLPEMFDTLDEAKDAGSRETEDCGPWDYRVLVFDSVTAAEVCDGEVVFDSDVW